MLTKIEAYGLKKGNFESDLTHKNIFSGPNGSGKSSRAFAISLLLKGYIPWTTRANPLKNAGDILTAYGKEDQIIVTGTFDNNDRLTRIFKKSKKGVASMSCKINDDKASKEDFAVKLHSLGNPAIFIPSKFAELSDQKKVDFIFSLFPAGGNVAEIDRKIQKVKDDIKNNEDEKKTIESSIHSLSITLNKSEKPSGSLPQLQSEIKNLEDQLQVLQTKLNNNTVEQERIKAEQKLKNDYDLKQKKMNADSEQKKKEMEEEATRQKEALQKQYDIDIQKKGSSAVESVERIIKSLETAKCESCATLLVAKNELKKLKAGNK